MKLSVVCEICKRTIEVHPSRAKKFRTCSHVCCAILKSGGISPQQRKCKNCGKTEIKNPTRAARPFCSQSCYFSYMQSMEHDPTPRDQEARRISRSRSKVKRARIANGYDDEVGDLTTEQWKSILKAFSGMCAYCGTTVENITIDHILPSSKGGKNVASNVVPACSFCNQSKKNKLRTPNFLPDGYRDLVESLS